MTRSSRFVASFVVAAIFGSVPVLLLARAMLTGPKAVTSEFPVVLLLPALGWLVPFALGLVWTWWRNVDLTPLRGAVLGFLSVCTYAVAIGIYLVAARNLDVAFLVLRLVFALPSGVAVAVMTAGSVWLVSRVFDRRSSRA